MIFLRLPVCLETNGRLFDSVGPFPTIEAAEKWWVENRPAETKGLSVGISYLHPPRDGEQISVVE